MKRLVPLVLLLLTATAAHASGIGLRWGSCEGTSNRNFACDGNTGAEMLVASFSPPPGVQALTGVAAYGHITSADSNLPAWWDLFNHGACRASSLSASFSLGDLTDCEDTWQGQGMGGIAVVKHDEVGLAFLIAVAIPETAGQPATSGRTYGAFKLFVNHQRTTGAGNCAGCSTPACITIDRMMLGQRRGFKELELTQGMSGLGGAGNVVTWQGGTPQCGAGASKPSSWGALKKIYR